ncbi:hypothetical protein WJX72_012552 [[Myrmecia] bisecta]|uniref:Uncharacterized protein n=1 Tax=[Myrmecia] bisecta TaxID=41462 RepID=A0AAW1P3U8_9CHLO
MPLAERCAPSLTGTSPPGKVYDHLVDEGVSTTIECPLYEILAAARATTAPAPGQYDVSAKSLHARRVDFRRPHMQELDGPFFLPPGVPSTRSRELAKAWVVPDSGLGPGSHDPCGIRLKRHSPNCTLGKARRLGSAPPALAPSLSRKLEQGRHDASSPDPPAGRPADAATIYVRAKSSLGLCDDRPTSGSPMEALAVDQHGCDVSASHQPKRPASETSLYASRAALRSSSRPHCSSWSALCPPSPLMRRNSSVLTAPPAAWDWESSAIEAAKAGFSSAHGGAWRAGGRNSRCSAIRPSRTSSRANNAAESMGGGTAQAEVVTGRHACLMLFVVNRIHYVHTKYVDIGSRLRTIGRDYMR